MVLTTVSGHYSHGILPTGLTPLSPSQVKNHIYLFSFQPNKYEILACKLEVIQLIEFLTSRRTRTEHPAFEPPRVDGKTEYKFRVSLMSAVTRT